VSSPYIEYGARVAAPPPFICRGGRFQAFVFKGDRSLLSELCERMLNGPAGGACHYAPIGEHVLILTGSFQSVASQAPGFSERGSVRETQLSLWVPALAHTTSPERSSLCMLVPYIFVDNSMSLLGGREDFGYPKAMGQFEPPGALGATVALSAFGGDFEPDNQATWRPLLALQGPETTGAQPVGEAEEWKTAAELARLIGDASATSSDTATSEQGLIRSLIEALLDHTVQQVFLKQLRNAGRADTTCYQAVVEAPVHVSNVRFCPSFDEWTLTIHPLDSHPIGTELGLANQGTRLTFKLELDMTVGTGTIVSPGVLAR
jgi:hypothetical protein